MHRSSRWELDGPNSFLPEAFALPYTAAQRLVRLSSWCLQGAKRGYKWPSPGQLVAQELLSLVFTLRGGNAVFTFVKVCVISGQDRICAL